MLKEMSLRGFNDNEDTLVAHLLKKWINPLYLQEDTVNQLHTSFHAQQPHYLHLQQFLLPSKAKTLLHHLQQLHYTLRYKPDQYRYHQALPAPSCKPFLHFLGSTALQRYLQRLTGKTVQRPSTFESIACQHQDYTLLHDKQQALQGIQVVMDFTPQWNNDAGGYDVYQLPKHDPLVIHPANNALTLIEATPNLQHFTKYVNSLASTRKQYRIQGKHISKET